MSIRGMLSQSVEDYLKAIYKLQEEGRVSTSELAARMEVSAASVTNMVKRLSTLGLVTYASYKGVRLSQTGEKIALEIIRHHRLLETYLREIMGYDWDKMHAEAEHLEHHISEEFENRLDQMLGYPTHDPHGDPIPARDGTLVLVESEPISSCPQGVDLTVRRVSDSSTEMLRELEALGLLPGASVKVLSGHADGTTLTVQSDETRLELGIDLASHVFASPTEL
jgi:DtxR family Mn-dependent transcriptional regulator